MADMVSQENRQKWREFCYGFENLGECAEKKITGSISETEMFRLLVKLIR